VTNLEVLEHVARTTLDDLMNIAEDMNCIVQDLDTSTDPEYYAISKEMLRQSYGEYKEIVEEAIEQLTKYLDAAKENGEPTSLSYHSILRQLKDQKFGKTKRK
jgi:uncharacterized protein YjgD (DUF1641 family)